MNTNNPLQPPEGKRTFALETKEPHYDNELVKLANKREIYRRRNEKYVKAMYGDPAGKEEVR